MRVIRERYYGLLVAVGLMTMLSPLHAQAEDWKWTPGGTQQGKWMMGFRAGFSPLTQSLSANTSTDVASVVNVQGMYALSQWLLVGLTVDWERRAVDQSRPSVDLGHQDTISLLPTMEARPGHFGPIAPYASLGFGVNVNSFDDNLPGTRISPSNNFAFRLASGADYFLTQKFALNTELAWKRNDGHVTINGVRSNDWNASSFSFLFGLRMFF
ncbi:MAG: outer membrane beta-barrel protein [Nitrospiraceae bacterium]